MTLDTFFKKFDQFADAPNAVAKMRELVMNLAVQGKIVDRISSEGAGSKILKDAGVTEERPEVAPNLPSHWSWARLGSITTRMDSGWSPACLSEPAETDEWGVLKTTSVQPLAYQEWQNKGLPQNLKPRPEHEVMDGDILFTRAGPMNRVGILCVARPTRQKLMISDKIIRFHLVSDIDPDFAALAMNAGYSSLIIENLKSGMAASQVNISQPKLRSIPLPLPPPSEQKRIVAKVDELMALCDRLEAKQQEREGQASALARASLARFADAPTPASLNLLFHKSYCIAPSDLRKSILTLAVQGKLVPSMGDTEIKPLGDILAEPSSNGISKGPTADTSATEVLRISAGTSRDDFYVDESDFKYVSLTAAEIKNATLRQGDLLACRYNGNLRFVGRFSLYRGESGRTQVNPDKLIRFRVDTARHDPRFVCFSMNSAATRAGIEAMCATTAGNIGLSAGRIKTVPLALPSLAEQRQIVAKVDLLMALVDQLEAQLAASRATAKNLLDALVAEIAI